MTRYLVLLLLILPVSQVSAQERERDISPVSSWAGFRWDPSRPSPDRLLPSGPVSVPVGQTEYYQVCAEATKGWHLVRGTVRINPRFGARDGAGCFVVCEEDRNDDSKTKEDSPKTAADCAGDKLETKICFLLRMSVNKGQTCEFNPYTITGKETQR
jgi:hypothetical protein